MSGQAAGGATREQLRRAAETALTRISHASREMRTACRSGGGQVSIDLAVFCAIRRPEGCRRGTRPPGAIVPMGQKALSPGVLTPEPPIATSRPERTSDWGLTITLKYCIVTICLIWYRLR